MNSNYDCMNFTLREKKLDGLLLKSEEYESDRFDKDYPPYGYDYQKFTLTALAFKTKYDREAADEILRRLSKLVNALSRNYCMYQHQFDSSEVRYVLNKAAYKAVGLFDPTKGKFEHLLRKMLKNALVYFASREKRAYLDEKRLFMAMSRNLDDERYVCFRDSRPLESEDMIKEIYFDQDFKEYFKLLSPEEQSILSLKIQGYTLREMSKILNIPFTTLSGKMQVLSKEIRQRMKRGVL